MATENSAGVNIHTIVYYPIDMMGKYKIQKPLDFYKSQEVLGKCVKVQPEGQGFNILMDARECPGTWLKLPLAKGTMLIPNQDVLACHLDWANINHTWKNGCLCINRH